jgi:hypothetical protein
VGAEGVQIPGFVSLRIIAGVILRLQVESALIETLLLQISVHWLCNKTGEFKKKAKTAMTIQSNFLHPRMINIFNNYKRGNTKFMPN